MREVMLSARKIVEQSLGIPWDCASEGEKRVARWTANWMVQLVDDCPYCGWAPGDGKHNVGLCETRCQDIDP